MQFWMVGWMAPGFRRWVIFSACDSVLTRLEQRKNEKRSEKGKNSASSGLGKKLRVCSEANEAARRCRESVAELKYEIH